MFLEKTEVGGTERVKTNTSTIKQLLSNTRKSSTTSLIKVLSFICSPDWNYLHNKKKKKKQNSISHALAVYLNHVTCPHHRKCSNHVGAKARVTRTRINWDWGGKQSVSRGLLSHVTVVAHRSQGLSCWHDHPLKALPRCMFTDERQTQLTKSIRKVNTCEKADV